ncbi:MAG: hypothetical protein ACR2NZ_00345, partial [Rubripirellula sp.]
MRRSLTGLLFGTLLAATYCAQPLATEAAELYGLTPGTVELQSAGPLSFGPSGVLFVGDPKAAKIYALNTEDSKSGAGSYDVDDLTAKVSSAFGGKEVAIVDMAVNPETGNAFLSVTAGSESGIARVSPDGTVAPLNLDKVANSSVTLPNAPEDKEVQRGRRRSNPRSSSITDLAYTAGRVLVAGLAAGDSPSSVREFDFPFNESASGFRVEIFHAAHGRSEDTSPIQAFVPFNIGGEPSLLAGYTCTPLVKIPIAKLESEAKVQGTTVAELGNRNRPLDMIVYKQHGKDFVLMANSARGVMKISTEDLENAKGLTEKVSGGGVAGQSYETIDAWEGVVQLDKLDDTHA